MDISNEDTDFTLLYLSLLSPIIYKDAEESQGAVKLLFTYIVMANLHFSVYFQKTTYIFSGHSPFYTTVSDKLKNLVRLVKLKYISVKLKYISDWSHSGLHQLRRLCGNSYQAICDSA